MVQTEAEATTAENSPSLHILSSDSGSVAEKSRASLLFAYRKNHSQKLLKSNQRRLSRLLGNLCLVGFIGGGAATIILSISAIVTDGIGISESFGIGLLLSLVLGCGGGWWFNERGYYRTGSQILTLGLFFTVAVAFISFGTSMPLMMAFMLPIALSVVLLSTTESIAIVLASVVVIVGLYFSQDVFAIYRPVTIVDDVGRFMAGMAVALVIIPAVATLLLLPFKSQLSFLQIQNRQLAATLAQLEIREKANIQVAQEVLILADSLEKIATQQAEGGQTQVEEVTEVRVAIAELVVTATNIAEFAHTVNASAEENSNTSQSIKETIEESVRQSAGGIAAVRETQAVSQRVATLYEQLREILNELTIKSENSRQILNLLTTIANETHLLSLNASIEAAGAGHYGERFAIVARQVKELAGRSARASNEVAVILQDIDLGVEAAVEAVEEGYQQTINLETVVGRAGVVIAQMNELVGRVEQQAEGIEQSASLVNQLTQQIKAETSQQQKASQNVQFTLDDLGYVANQNAERSTQVLQSARELEAVTYRLAGKNNYSLEEDLG